MSLKPFEKPSYITVYHIFYIFLLEQFGNFLLEQFGSSHLKNQAISPFSRNSYGFEPWGSGNLNVIGRQVPTLLYAHPPALTVCNSGLRPQLFVTWSFTFEIKLPSQFLNPLSLNLRLWSMLELCLSRPPSRPLELAFTGFDTFEYSYEKSRVFFFMNSISMATFLIILIGQP